MRQNFFTFAITLLTMLFSTTAFATSIAYPADGIYSIQPQCAPDKELSVQNHASNWGANVIIDNINPNWRKWKVQRIGNTDFYSIIAVHSNLALDVANAQASNGVNIATWPFLNERPNAFRIMDTGNGYYVIQCAIDGSHPFVVDVANGENRAGANVHSWGFNNSPAQLWRLVPVQRLSTFQTFNKKATKKVTAYVMPDLQARSGNEYVSAGDDVTVLREEGNAYLVRYPVSSGTKTRWVNKNEIFSGGNPTQTPAPTTTTNPTSNGDWNSKVNQQLANIYSDNYTSKNPYYRYGYSRQCTWYAWGRMRELTGKEINFGGNYPRANLWKSNATNCSTCELQSRCIAVRISGGGGNGHVAFVEYVDNNYVYYTDDNWNSNTNLKVQRKTISEFKNLYQYFIR